MPIYDEILGSTYTACVVGFLQEGAVAAHANYGQTECMERVLDHSVLVPIFTQAAALGSVELMNDITTYYSGGIIAVPQGTSAAKFVQAQRAVNDIFVRNGYAPMFFGVPTFGMVYFQTESAASMRLLLAIVLLAAAFCMVLVGLHFMAIIQRNLRGYAVRMMLGMPRSAVVAAFLVELFGVLLCPMALVCSIFWQQIVADQSFVLLIGGLQLGMGAILGSILAVRLLHLDLEQAMRRPE